MRKKEVTRFTELCKRPRCQKPFYAKRKSAEYCTNACRQAHYRERKEDKKVNCAWCDKLTDPSPAIIGFDYCSDDCEQQSQSSQRYFLRKKAKQLDYFL